MRPNSSVDLLAGIQQIPALCRPLCQRRAVLVPVLSFGATIVDETVSGAASVQERHQTDVGGSDERTGRQVGDSIAEKQNRSRLGERLHGDAGRTVSRWSGGVRYRSVHTVSGMCCIYLAVSTGQKACTFNTILMIFVIAQEDLLSVWNRTASDTASTNRIRDTLRRILNLPPTTLLEYKNHNECLKYLKTPPSNPNSLSLNSSSGISSHIATSGGVGSGSGSTLTSTSAGMSSTTPSSGASAGVASSATSTAATTS